MFQPLKGHLQEVYLMQSSRTGQQNETTVLKFCKSSKIHYK